MRLGPECSAHTKTKWLLLFIPSFFLSFFIDHRRERQCSYARSTFFLSVFWLAPFRWTREKKVFLFVPSFRYHIIMCRYWKCPYNVVAASSDGTSIFTGIIYLVFFFYVRCGAHHITLCVRWTYFFFSLYIFFWIIFIIKFSPLILRPTCASHWRLARHTQFFFFESNNNTALLMCIICIYVKLNKRSG